MKMQLYDTPVMRKDNTINNMWLSRQDDAKCNVEVVEQANAEQLHSILSSIRNCTYFRLSVSNSQIVLPVAALFSCNTLFFLRVKVDLSTSCPWDAKGKKTERKESMHSQPNERADSHSPAPTEERDVEPECDSQSPFGDGSSMCSLSLEQEEPDEEETCETEQRLENGHSMCSLTTDTQLGEQHAFGLSPTPALNTRCCRERMLVRVSL